MGKGRIDVSHVVAVGDAVEQEKRRVQLGAQKQAPLLVPREGRADLAVIIDIPHVASEGGHVVGRVRQFQHRIANDFAGVFRAETFGLVPFGRDNR